MEKKMNLEKANKLTEGYCGYLKGLFDIKDVGNGWVDITTPFLDSRRDYIGVCIGRISDGAFVLTDDGQTLSNLTLAGLDTSSDEFNRVLTEQLNGSGVVLGGTNKSELRKSYTEGNFKTAFHEFIQCILAIDALSVVNRLR